MVRDVDLVVLSRNSRDLMPEVQQGISAQRGVRLHVHRVVGKPRRQDVCRWETIARARNQGKELGASPWLMFVDDDVVLRPDCLLKLLNTLYQQPSMGALAADYLGESRARGRNGPARHVAMGATLFRRSVLNRFQFRWEQDRCECQCCCDDLRRKGIGIAYCPEARATHLTSPSATEHTGLVSDTGSSLGLAENRAAATRILLVHHGLVDYHGHFFNQALGFKTEAERRGIPLHIFADRNVRRVVARRLDAIRAFRNQYASQPSSRAQRLRWMKRQGAVFAQDLNRFLPRNLTPDDILLINTATEAVLFGLYLWARERAVEQRPLIAAHFHRLYEFDAPPRIKRRAEAYRFAGRLLRRVVGNGGFLPIVAVPDLAEEAARTFGRSAAVLGDAMYYGGIAPPRNRGKDSRPASDTVTVGFLGKSKQPWRAKEKGVDLLPAIIKSTLAKQPRVRFKLQVELDPFRSGHMVELQKLAAHPSVTFVKTGLVFEDYRSLLHQLDIMLLPYDPAAYAKISSGIFAEALAAGVVTVVPGQTRMAQQLEANCDAGVAFWPYHADAVADALLTAVHNIEQLRDRARQNAASWRQESSVQAYLDGLLAHKSGRMWGQADRSSLSELRVESHLPALS